MRLRGVAVGREAAGREAAGREAVGREAAGREAAGREAVGRDRRPTAFAVPLRDDATPSPGARVSVSGRGPTFLTTGASDLSSFLAGVLSGYSQRSEMMHFGHAGTRATQTYRP